MSELAWYAVAFFVAFAALVVLVRAVGGKPMAYPAKESPRWAVRLGGCLLLVCIFSAIVLVVAASKALGIKEDFATYAALAAGVPLFITARKLLVRLTARLGPGYP